MTRALVQLRRAMNWGRHAGPARLVLVAAAVLGIIAAVRPEVLTSQDPNAINAHAILVGPNWAHWLGTNEEGSDVLARIIYGTRLDLLLAVGSAGIAGVVSLTESRANALIGVFISITTLPAAASIGLSVAFGSWHDALGSLYQLLLNVVILIVVGAAGLSAQRGLWHRLAGPDEGATGWRWD